LKFETLKDLQKRVVKEKADFGIATDGDGDRCLFVDEKGEEFDGNFTIALVGKYLNDKNKLNKSTLVGTSMTNLGFDNFCKREKIKLVKTEVGDKYVMAEMIKNGYNFGGEQSGHIIFLDPDKIGGGIVAAAGDGIIASLLVMRIMKEMGKKLSQLRMFEPVPQILINIEVKEKTDFANIGSVKKAIEMHKKRLGEDSDINVRNSGTQKLCRVTVQGKDAKKVKEAANDIAKAVKQAD
jgi:phosphoglucosamine mutase